MRKTGINNKLIRAFVIQLLFISVVTALGVYVAAIIVEQVMVKTALEDEAKHHWAQLNVNPEHPAPNTDNLRGYISTSGDLSTVPQALHTLEGNYGRVDYLGHKPIFYKETKNDKTLYLLFDEQSVRALSFYFGVVPLSLVLIVIYLSAWFVYKYSRKTLSPLMSLAQTMRGFDLSKDKLDSLQLDNYINTNIDDEVSVLADSLKDFTLRLKKQLQREREFTHDVSHELRTPLAVIKGSLELLNKQKDISPAQQRAINRMQTTSGDMLAMIETLLVLARDSETADGLRETVVLDKVLPPLIQQVNNTHNNDQHVEISLEKKADLRVDAPTQAVCIVLSNLLRNACNYTQQGTVVVTIHKDSVSIADSGIGIAEEELARVQRPFERSSTVEGGYGLGLDIVKRLCQRFDWELKIASKVGVGTTITIRFSA
ncbi:HAMP domain-containing histidine kinase [Leucothrix sargassi]|nr:HAMP domain-containing histidine kinase [Leucothrix sargassi]